MRSAYLIRFMPSISSASSSRLRALISRESVLSEVPMARLEHAALREHIERVGITIFESL